MGSKKETFNVQIMCSFQGQRNLPKDIVNLEKHRFSHECFTRSDASQEAFRSQHITTNVRIYTYDPCRPKLILMVHHKVG